MFSSVQKRFAIALLLVGGSFGCSKSNSDDPQAEDKTAPSVSSAFPLRAATSVALDGNIAATFSEAMDPATIKSATLTLKQGSTKIAGVVRYSGVTATFDPTNMLTPNTLYTATITTRARDLAGNAISLRYTWDFTTGSALDTTAPMVNATVPQISATGIARDASLAATFSEAMDSASISTSSFRLKQGTGIGATTVSGAVSYSGITAIFNPITTLTANTLYVATITTGAKDLSGNKLDKSYSWTFTTGAEPDTTPPSVSATVPAASATGIALSSALTLTFSEAMDPLSIHTSSITLKQGTTAIAGTVTYSGVSATFDPIVALVTSTLYVATITTAAKDLAGNPLAATYTWNFTTGAAADTAVPTVSSTTPLEAAVGVALSGNIAATFSEAIDPPTLSSSTFTLKQGAATVLGSITYTGVTATFNPTSDLAANTTFTANLSTGVKDLAGNSLAAAYSWSFTTGAVPDTTAPSVSLTVPLDAATGVALGSTIAITFSEAVDPLTISTSTFALHQGLTIIPGAVTYSGVTAIFDPITDLSADTGYTASITTVVADLAGNTLPASYVWDFTTGTLPDVVVPTVLSSEPSDDEVDVAINRSVNAMFSEAMDPTTLSTASFTLEGPGVTPVSGAVSYVGSQATFNPLADLAPNTLYTATITTNAKDLAGNPLASSFAWSFTTRTTTALGPNPVLLGLAGDFAILAKSGIDTIPTSAITGDIGVSPIDSTGITGFSLIMDSGNEFSTSGQVTGQIWAPDYTSPTPSYLTTAVSDMETAYTDAAGRVTPDFTELGAGEIGGMTLVPGLYKWGTGVSITTDLTLNGGPEDVWIFQISGDVTQANGTSITLSGGALPKNIFWQTFGQVMIGTTAHFEGIALCQTAIVLGTGASINGRLLAQTAVTIDSSTVVEPAP